MHRPRKRFGQHFLHDPAVIDRIVNAIDPQTGQRLVEIGPGQGAITLPLLKRVSHLDVIELDRDLVAALSRQYKNDDQITIHNADALRFDFATLGSASQPLRIVGNLPYNISTPLMFCLIEQRAIVEDMHFMLQKEVVDRLVADPGCKAYGRLGVMVSTYCAAERLFDIGSGAFKPPPKVSSAFLRLTPYTKPPFDISDAGIFAQLVNQAFSMRRKTLRNSLRGFVDEATIKSVDIDPQRRPETLTPSEFAKLANIAVDLHL